MAEPQDGLPERRKFVKVAVNAGRMTYLDFSYAVPLGREVVPGEVVHVPWGQRTLQGIVIDGPFDTPGYDPDAVRELEPPVEGAPVVSPERLELASWVRHYYLAPAWETYSLVLPPGAGERPISMVARAREHLEESEPSALSDRQQAIWDALRAEPAVIDDLKARLKDAVPARSFDSALNTLLRRGLAERRYRLEPPRGKVRVLEVVRLATTPERARAFADGIEGKRSSRRARAIRAAMRAEDGVPFEVAAKEARGAPAVDTLV
ncbi:MAG: hypothetical protein KC472_07760, partial [Dehalococcoidia bacterium]|nr:hypothetical protein [Dehalococcoidia bacterium]